MMSAYLACVMNSFNKTEAAVFLCRLCFLRAFPFISLICYNLTCNALIPEKCTRNVQFLQKNPL